MLYISLRQREKEVVMLVTFFKDAEREQQERTEPNTIQVFKKGGRKIFKMFYLFILQEKDTVWGGG